MKQLLQIYFENLFEKYKKFKLSKRWKLTTTLNNGSKLTNQNLSMLRKEGLIVIPNYLDKDNCSKIIDEIINLKNQSIGISGAAESDWRIYNFDSYSKIGNLFYKDLGLINFFTNYLKAPIYNLTTLAGMLNPSTDQLGSGGDWHRDVNHPQVKAMIYLTDVSKVDDGSFQYYAKSHKIKNIGIDSGLIRKNASTRWTQEEVNKFMTKYDLNSVLGKAGDLVLFDTSLVHRGAPLKNGQRFALTNYYYDSGVDTIAMLRHFGVL
jgi:hypothetical protein